MHSAGLWIYNEVIWSGVSAWILAQLIKLYLHYKKHRTFDPAFLLRLGGMPSSHSAAVCAVATTVGMLQGFDSSVFGVALMLSLIVMIDAQSVRRAAGQQARLLNQIIDELFREHHFSQQKLVELLGHTRLEVLLGMILGILVAVLIHSFL